MKASLFACALVVGASLFAADDWQPLFNGKDLSGWVPVNVAPNTFTVRDGIIVTTGVPTGVMRTEKQYENFELELEWKHIVPQGNAGLFVWSDPITAPGQPFTRAIEVQILDGRNSETHTSHGDIFSIHGARMTPDRPHPRGGERCLPSEFRCKPAGEWNHYRVVCKDGVIKLSVNGKEVSGGSQSTPRKGYICLESEGSECHFRNIRIKELPSSNPKPKEIAPLADGFVSLYNGLNLDGWTTTRKHAKHWKAKDWILSYDGDSDRNNAYLWSTKRYRDFVMIVDWRLPDKDKVPREVGVVIRSDQAPLNFVGDAPNGQWNRAMITVRGNHLTMDLNGEPLLTKEIPKAPREGPVGLQQRKFPIEFANIYIKELPSSNPKPDEGPLAAGFISIYNGLNLDGWTSKGRHHWKANDWILQYDGKGTDADLWFNKPIAKFDLIVDWRVTDKNAKHEAGFQLESVGPDGSREVNGMITQSNKKLGEWNRSTFQVRGNEFKVKVDTGGVLGGSGNPPDATKPQRFGLQALGHPIEFANIYLKELPEK